MDEREALEILGLEAGADSETVERAYRERRAIYDGGSLATYSLMDDDERRSQLRRVEAAFELLRPREPAPAASTPAAAESRPPRRDVPLPAFEGTRPGAFLRRCRELRGLTLEELAKTTRISRAQLSGLEQEEFSRLPPIAYVRGFALQYARALGIREAESVASSMVESYRNPG